MGSVTISGNNYTIYGSQAAAVIHMAGQIAPRATAWVAASPDKQAQSLVTATGVLDRQLWQTAVNTFALRDAIPAFQTACYELAALLLAKPALLDAMTADSNVESVTAGPTSVSFFKPTLVGRFPTVVQELIGSYLAAAESAIGGGSEALGDGVCAKSSFNDSSRYSLI